VVLGLHYPTDVLAGAALGALIAAASQVVFF
jgi:membrane-associated phospholipid phosphatase